LAAWPSPFVPENDHDFLIRRGVPKNLLAAASQHASRHATEILQELFALGFDRQRYWSILADDLGLRFASDLAGASLCTHADMLATDAVRHATSVLVRIRGKTVLVAAPRQDETALLRRRLKLNPTLGHRIQIAAPETIRAFIVAQRHPALTHYALNRLAGVLPRLSTAPRLANNSRRPTLLLAAALALALVAPIAALTTLGLLSTLFFVNCSFWKLATAFRRLRPFRLEPIFDDHLPTYAVLVPLYREAAVVEDLVAHLGCIDYPKSKLQILLILEADDHETRSAALRHVSAPHFEVLSVPPRGPRTKPKALTYALSLVRADYVVVFDAEDRPEPDQLRKAVAAFRERPGLGCVQARLAPDNDDSWLARMFTVEYAANFEVLLPALAEWRLPLPLGGTSNHFPRAVLEKVAAWDPFNVTEDADLGVRLARFGYETATILSRTYEEAPVTLRQWLPQRRRWIKGWIQTVMLCWGPGISPGLRLPLRQQLAFHGILSAGVLGLLLYPASLWVIGVAIADAVKGSWPTSMLAWLLLTLNVGNLLAVLLATAVSAMRGLASAHALRLVWHIPLLPLYWAPMSFAAWQALFQYFQKPSDWEKTAHGVARARRKPRLSSAF
jgi:cellulose synthase/poly-beta-1,6-N-acetylglucosamine synthase-like glycosyltransferase